MKIFSTQIIILLLIFQSVLAQDTVYIDSPGIVGGTWTPNKHYIARWNVLVPYDSVLTIQAGVTIEIQNGFSFKVEGTLNAVGNANSHIEFSAYDEYWEGMSFGTPSGESIVKSSLLSFTDIDCGSAIENTEAIVIGKHTINSLNHLWISNADQAIRITGFANNDNISNCYFQDVNRGVIYQYCDNIDQIVIQNCSFSKIYDRAIYISQNEANLENIEVTECLFDNGSLTDNQSGAAICINLNEKLTEISIDQCSFHKFSHQANSPACIYINNNILLDEVTLELDTVTSCGGNSLSSPSADFGGLYVNRSQSVELYQNEFLNNTGIKSGAAFLNAGQIYMSENTFTGNRNNVPEDSASFAGAITIFADERLKMQGDEISDNFSTKSGGAIFITSSGNTVPLDLIFENITLLNNYANNAGGAILINASLDTISISGSEIKGNFSSAGSGGCLSIITSTFNELILESDTLQNNFVNGTSEGGFLFLQHNPALIPDYGNIRMNDNVVTVLNPDSQKNYSILFSPVKSFPETITVSGDHVYNCYPAHDYLYHFELLQDGPEPPDQNVLITFTDNKFENNQSPVLYFENSMADVVVDFENNLVVGAGNHSTFLTLECNKVHSADFEEEQYSGLISGPAGGGAVTIKAASEIGAVSFHKVTSEKCFSVEGKGGHFSLISGASDPSAKQSITISESYFSNEGLSTPTGGDGGAIYFQTPDQLDSLIITDCDFKQLHSGESGGALYINSKEMAKVVILGSHFEGNTAGDTAGAVYVNAFNGSIREVTLAPFDENPTTFTDCSSGNEGGALCLAASKEIGSTWINSLSSSGCKATNGNGGHLYLASFGADATIKQDLVIRNANFSCSPDDVTGGDGGAVYYYSEEGNVDSVIIQSSHFTGLSAQGSGGALFARALSFDKVSLAGCEFSMDKSINADAGALYVQATTGNIIDLLMYPHGETQTTFTSCSAKTGGGVMFAKAAKEIGKIIMEEIESKKSFASESNGGHFAFISSLDDQTFPQEIHISGSLFDNFGISNMTGGDGGAIYFTTLGKLDSLNIRSSGFSNLKSSGKGGALCIATKETAAANIMGSSFSNLSSLQDTAGAFYLSAFNGNIEKVSFVPLEGLSSSFIDCNASYDGGAFCVRASREVGLIMLDTVIMEGCYSSNGNGGFGSLISFGTDSDMVQEISISRSVFTNEGANDLTGENGGILYYDAESDLSLVNISHSTFTNPRAVKDGGSLYIKAEKIDAFSLNESLFSGSVSQVLSGGALFVRTNKGLISGNFTSNSFINCSAGLMGGSMFLEDGKYDNTSEHLSWSGNTFRIISPEGKPELGGAVFCKGYNEVSFQADSAISQTATEKGGFIYLEKVYRSQFNEIYTYSNKADIGGVICHIGDPETSSRQSTRIFGSSFLFNAAGQTGGCFYISDIDSVEIGRENRKNNFVANQSMAPVSTNDQLGGGVLYIGNAQNLDVSHNSFYVNGALNYGGVGIISNVSTSLLIKNNSILSNQANIGGAFTLFNSFPSGMIEDNNFSFNISSEQGGALFFAPQNGGNIQVRDNTFFKNSAGKLGGAIASYRPVRLTRNLFRENHLVGLIQVNPKGNTVYLTGSGDQSVIKNCVFDQNYYEANDTVASIYFDVPGATPPIFSLSNCSFFNYSDKHLSVFNAQNENIFIENSIFTQRENSSRDEPVRYFNQKVKSRYCDLIYSQVYDTINHNYSEYVDFNVGDYYFDSGQYPVDQGNPDPLFNDLNLPPAYPTLRNDLGVSGGPDNPDTSSVFIFEEPANLPNNFDLVVTRDCFTFTFKCMGEYVDDYESFYWFMPDSIILTENPELTYTFSPDLYGNFSITALGHDADNADVYGFGQYNFNLDIIRILSLATESGSNFLSVNSVPFNFNILAEIEVENDTEFDYSWEVIEHPGVEYTITTNETGCSVEIGKIISLPASITIRYTLSACDDLRVVDSVITVNFQTAEWGYPKISFYPEPNEITCETSSFRIEFSKIITDEAGNQLTNGVLDDYISVDQNPVCPELAFSKTVDNTTGKTIMTMIPIDQNTQQVKFLCNGDYTFDLESSKLYTEFYKLNSNDTSKVYSVHDLSVHEVDGLLPAIIYPNPFSSYIYIEFEKSGDYFYEITTLQGVVQKNGKLSVVDEVKLNLDDLADGFYILYIVNTDNSECLYQKLNKITH